MVCPIHVLYQSSFIVILMYDEIPIFSTYIEETFLYLILSNKFWYLSSYNRCVHVLLACRAPSQLVDLVFKPCFLLKFFFLISQVTIVVVKDLIKLSKLIKSLSYPGWAMALRSHVYLQWQNITEAKLGSCLATVYQIWFTFPPFEAGKKYSHHSKS